MAPRSLFILLAVLGTAALAPVPQIAEETRPGDEIFRAWVCPLHPEQHHAGPGRCEVCGTPFEERALTYRWSCPVHHHQVSGASGVCADGTPRVPELRAWAHGDHNPRHGGVFFMATDRKHHIEGVMEPGRFVLYVYDDYTRPLELSGVRARIGDVVLRPTADGSALQAPFTPAGDPIEVVLQVDFGQGENRFDFVFEHDAVPHQHRGERQRSVARGSTSTSKATVETAARCLKSSQTR